MQRGLRVKILQGAIEKSSILLSQYSNMAIFNEYQKLFRISMVAIIFLLTVLALGSCQKCVKYYVDTSILMGNKQLNYKLYYI